MTGTLESANLWAVRAQPAGCPAGWWRKGRPFATAIYVATEMTVLFCQKAIWLPLPLKCCAYISAVPVTRLGDREVHTRIHTHTCTHARTCTHTDSWVEKHNMYFMLKLHMRFVKNKKKVRNTCYTSLVSDGTPFISMDRRKRSFYYIEQIGMFEIGSAGPLRCESKICLTHSTIVCPCLPLFPIIDNPLGAGASHQDLDQCGREGASASDVTIVRDSICTTWHCAALQWVGLWTKLSSSLIFIRDVSLHFSWLIMMILFDRI